MDQAFVSGLYPGRLCAEVTFGHVQSGQYPGHTREVMSPGWLQEASVSSQKSWRKRAGEMEV